MSEEIYVLVCGIDDIASAIARRLFGEERMVVIHQPAPPRTLLRRMAYSDAWFDGYASLDGIEARRADLSSEFLLGLQTRQFIPLLTQRFSDVVERWPWDVIVSLQTEGDSSPEDIRSCADLTIGLGRDFIAGVHCDVVIETAGADPGAIIRSGGASRTQTRAGYEEERLCDIFAPASGVFQASKIIGAVVEAGEALGFIGERMVEAPVSGRVRGLVRNGQAVVAGSLISEIATSTTVTVAGVSKRNQLISSGVAFAVEAETSGWEPISFQTWR